MKILEYRAPIAGFYQISSYVTRATPTGKYETVPNPDRKWYTPWLLRTIQQQIYTFETVSEGREVRRLEKDEVVKSTFEPMRLGT